MRTVREAWESYEKGVLPPDAHHSQRIETRRAFYSGAFVMLGTVSALGDDSFSEAQGVARLEGLRAECVGFFALVQAGLA